MSPADIAKAIEDALSQRPPDDAHVDILCECGYGEDQSIERTIVHALYEHTTRGALIMRRTTEMLDPYRLAQMAGAPALTEHEEKWRAQQVA